METISYRRFLYSRIYTYTTSSNIQTRRASMDMYIRPILRGFSTIYIRGYNICMVRRKSSAHWREWAARIDGWWAFASHLLMSSVNSCRHVFFLPLFSLSLSSCSFCLSSRSYKYLLTIAFDILHTPGYKALPAHPFSRNFDIILGFRFPIEEKLIAFFSFFFLPSNSNRMDISMI